MTVREIEVLGPWSLASSGAFWEGFTPAALPNQSGGELRTAFCVEGSWQRTQVVVTQHDSTARVRIAGDADPDAVLAQTSRMLGLDVDGRGWPDVVAADPVLAPLVAERPGLRPCGFHSPYEAAAWAVLSQRICMTQAARLCSELAARLGDDGAFPAPAVLHTADLDLPGRKPEYLQAVAEAALEGRLDGAALRALDPADAVAQVREVKGLGPFAAELVVIRGANAPDVAPAHERRLEAEVRARYGAPLESVAPSWRPYRTWAAVHLRAAAEPR